MSRILLIGGHGQVGRELAILLPGALSLARPVIDLSQPDRLREVIRSAAPSLIINAAAYTAVDRAESESELAQLVNATAPTVMAEEADRLGAGLIHLSTDYVFDGQKNTPYLASDPTGPTSVYGRTKLAGEVGIRATGCQHVILRTAWVYGVYGQGNFVKTMLRLGREREQLKVVVDQLGTPTWARHIAETVVALGAQLQPEAFPAVMPVENPAANPVQASSGTYHFTNSGVTSWYDFAVAIFEEARALGWPLKVTQVLPITTADYPTPAQRPAYSVLSGQEISAILGEYPAHWRQALRQMLAQLEEQSP
jgi:dTDP-4-dehydrorhamnose reductase